MYGSRGAMSGGVSDGYEGTKRQRMMDSNPYFAVSVGGIADGYDAGIMSKRQRMLDPPPNPYGGFYPHFGNYGIAGSSSSIGGNIYNFPVVRLRGLPFNCEDLDVYKFFAGLDVVDCLLVNKNGRFSGEAFVVLSTPMQADLALERNRQNMGRRYIEVFRCKKQEYYQAITNEVSNGGSFEGSPPPRPKKTSAAVAIDEDKSQLEYTQVLKLRGLPYSASVNDILEFFGDEYKIEEEKVHIARHPDTFAAGYITTPAGQNALVAVTQNLHVAPEDVFALSIIAVQFFAIASKMFAAFEGCPTIFLMLASSAIGDTFLQCRRLAWVMYIPCALALYPTTMDRMLLMVFKLMHAHCVLHTVFCNFESLNVLELYLIYQSIKLHGQSRRSFLYL